MNNKKIKKFDKYKSGKNESKDKQIYRNHDSKSSNLSQKKSTNATDLEVIYADILVIGAGPAGLMAGITAAEKGKKVVIIESNSVAGKKLATTGNGKCNFTNRLQEPECYRSDDSKKAFSIVERFNSDKVIEFFKSIGIPCRERNGYCYPYSEQAKSFRDVFVEKALALGINIIYDTTVTAVDVKLQNNNTHISNTGDTVLENGVGGDYKFQIICSSGERYYASKVIVCCGGLSYKTFGCTGTGFDIAQKFGMKVITPSNALNSLETDYDSIKWLEGVRAQVEIKLTSSDKNLTPYIERGEIIFSKSGISGIPVLNASRFSVNFLKQGKKVSIQIDFAKDFEYDDLFKYITDVFERAGINGKKKTNNAGNYVIKTPKDALKGILNDKLLTVIEYNIDKGVAHDGSKLDRNVSKVKAYTDYIKKFTINISGVADIDKAQVTQGGVCLDELSENMESLKVPGLYFAGENVDVDGKCGGYNLQWAFSSGYVAGISAAE